MNIQHKDIDNGKAFDWGRTSEDYAKYRDIYPPIFYDKIVERGYCIEGQEVLDLGTGTGVLPRNMYHYGAIQKEAMPYTKSTVCHPALTSVTNPALFFYGQNTKNTGTQ